MVIGLVGESGAGKDTFIQMLWKIARGKRGMHLSTSHALRTTCALWHLPRTRTTLQTLPVVMNTAFGAGTFTNVIRQSIRGEVEAFDIVAVNALRLPTDMAMIREFAPSLLVY
ncbi:MAG: hypothetical protein HY460_00110, partial [Parcubacteria group bacterium]|nr:hypothetical protein [Parcubacteria group bacterium]